MKNIKTKFFFTLFFCSINTFAQNEERKKHPGYSFAKKKLISALKNKLQNNIINKKNIILKDSITAINIVEPILFSIYGKKNILKQKPYVIFFIDNYWLINGTLPKCSKCGTFEIIVNVIDCKVILITHDK
jgi:hypothetical protein